MLNDNVDDVDEEEDGNGCVHYSRGAHRDTTLVYVYRLYDLMWWMFSFIYFSLSVVILEVLSNLITLMFMKKLKSNGS